MSKRFELNENDVDRVVGGVLLWEAGKVYPKDNPSAVYKYKSFTKCMQWIDENWSTVQNEDCLRAMETAGLVSKL